MVTLDNISFEFSARWLYRNTTLQVKPGDKIGLIGRNGTGKTTVLRLIMGDYTPTEGNISMPKGTKIGFLNQDLLEFKSDKSAFETALEAFEVQLTLQKEIDALLKKMESDSDPNLVKQLTEKQTELESLDGYNIEFKTHSLLAGLGFSEKEQKMPFNTFSGGWRMRIMLAKILLQEPDLLLLDEPTNHLDLPSIKWIESYLKSFPGAFIIVSHDRYFIDRLVNKVVEIDQCKFNSYTGNYSFFLKEKAIRKEQHQREFENQQKYIAEQEKLINRFRAKASKAKMAQSKIKMLEKLERIEAPEADAAVMRLQFEADVVPGKKIFEIEVEDKSYGDKQILSDTGGLAMRGDKIALIGANGLGKSTLLRMSAGTEPFEGRLLPGHNVHQSMFAQHALDSLDPENNILQEMNEFIGKKTETQIRNILGCFLFSGDDILKKIKVLSGGEKSRVALAKTLLSQANFLLLDEPTNHLDIQSIEILIEALQNYDGSFIVVSHDRYFLGRVANKIWYIEDKKVKEYPGTYAEFEVFQAKKQDEPSTPAPKKKVVVETATTSQEKDTKSQYEADKRAKRRKQKLESDLSKTEAGIMKLEEKKTSYSAQMADPEVASDFQKLFDMQAEMDQMEKELEGLNKKWEKIVEEMENEK